MQDGRKCPGTLKITVEKLCLLKLNQKKIGLLKWHVTSVQKSLPSILLCNKLQPARNKDHFKTLCSFFFYCQNKLILASIHWCFLTLEIRFTVHWQCPFDEFTQLRSHSKIYYVSIFLLNCPHAQCLNKMGCILGSVREIKCDVMFESERKSSICCWTYFILCWNGFKKRMSKHSLWII